MFIIIIIFFICSPDFAYSNKAKVNLQSKTGLVYLHSRLLLLLIKVILKFINQISTPCQILIKEGYFNLSTMLNLKSLWMYRIRIHPN
jgi:hypothetical protein